MVWKVIINLFLLSLFLILQISFFSYLPILVYFNLAIFWLIFSRLTNKISGLFFFGLVIFVGFVRDLISPQFAGFYILLLFIWATFFDWLVKKIFSLNLLSMTLLSVFGIMVYEIIFLLLERIFFFVHLQEFATIFDRFYFFNLLKVILFNASLCVLFLLFIKPTKKDIYLSK